MTLTSLRTTPKKWMWPAFQIAIFALWLVLSFLWLWTLLSTELHDSTVVRRPLWNDNKRQSLSLEYLYAKGNFCEAASPCRLSFPQEYDQRSSSSHLVTKKGIKMGLPNQDRCLLVQSDHQKMTMAALFDGHGENGHWASDQAIRELPFRLLESNRDSTNIETVIRDAFLATDASPAIQQINDGGTSAVIVWRIGTTVYLASTGDSTGLLVHYRNGKSNVIAEAVKHKPADPLERARIEAAGGTVLVPEAMDATSRVIYTTHQGQEMGLAMSRCIGDFDGKTPGYLIAEPSVLIHDLDSGLDDSNSFYYLVVASDGLVDEVSRDHLLTQLGETLKHGGRDLSKVVHQLLNEASQSWRLKMMGTYRDDMSLIVTRLTI